MRLQIIVSDTPCMREVYGDCAAYIDLCTNPGDVSAVTPATPLPTAALLEKYSWDKSAAKTAANSRKIRMLSVTNEEALKKIPAGHRLLE